MTDSQSPLSPRYDTGDDAVSRSHKPDDIHAGHHTLYPDDVPFESTDELMLKFLNIP